ncbi:cytochrome P450 [Sparassis crispa]|uniref:Cytochrome P450 n=1 Tax=Sparassis crispa TaxID=139825 RepID=A0A401GX65_9APHY|nr:cytochrome P450 [Sparassis crispa]GBE86826.1 cytochrome P450 [Sparassis crispa]
MNGWPISSGRANSDVIYVNAAGTPVIVLNSAEAAYDLLKKRSSIYSDRMRMAMVNDLIGANWFFTFMGYGQDWRVRRQAFHQEFHPAAAVKYRPRQVKVARELLRHLLADPDAFLEHLRHMSGALIISVVYGLDVPPKDDPYIAIAEKANHALIMAGNAALTLLPSETHTDMVSRGPLQAPSVGVEKANDGHDTGSVPAVKEAIADGVASPSVAMSLLSKLNEDDNYTEYEYVYRGVAAAAFSGGADTTLSALGSFFLAMVLYPAVQRKAQEELDRIVGRDRLPEFSDEPSLPYVTAVIRELLRWRPLAIPHRLMVEDVYRGYRLPAGSMVVGNVCSVLASFDIMKAVDVDGKEMEPTGEYSTGIIRYV